MNTMFKCGIYVLEIFIAFSSGIIIGAGFLALLTILGVIQRLLQMLKFRTHLTLFFLVFIFGVLFGTYLSFTSTWIEAPDFVVIIWGFIHGIFNGMLAAALVEILNVFPLLSRRLQLESHLFILLMAIVFGKICGALFQWFFLQ